MSRPDQVSSPLPQRHQIGWAAPHRSGELRSLQNGSPLHTLWRAPLEIPLAGAPTPGQLWATRERVVVYKPSVARGACANFHLITGDRQVSYVLIPGHSSKRSFFSLKMLLRAGERQVDQFGPFT